MTSDRGSAILGASAGRKNTVSETAGLRLAAVAGLVAALCLSSVASAQGTDTSVPHTGFWNGKVWVKSRYRYEDVDQAGFAENARASTIGVRPGIESGIFHGFKVGVEADLIGEIGPDDFNNRINGKVQYPVVADVESVELNQAYIQSHHVPGVVITGGRYTQDLDNWRFIGQVIWRQNNQTFDGAKVEVTSIPGVEIYYGYIGNVNTIFSDDGSDGAPTDGNLSSNIHNINVKANLPASLGVLTGYTYLMDIQDLDALSNATYGGFIEGKQKIFSGVTFNYRIEYAHQTDYGDQPISYSADYWHLQPGVTVGGFTTTFGYEKLGSDGGLIGFQTPLATAHKFNGFADVFLATPATGLKDFYVDLTYKAKGLPEQFSFFEGLLVTAQYHEFRSDVGDADFGHEFDLYIRQPLKAYEGLAVDFKFAGYHGGSAGFADRDKYILGITYDY